MAPPAPPSPPAQAGPGSQPPRGTPSISGHAHKQAVGGRVGSQSSGTKEVWGVWCKEVCFIGPLQVGGGEGLETGDGGVFPLSQHGDARVPFVLLCDNSPCT